MTQSNSITPVDQEIFRDVVGHFTTGVTVITTTEDNSPTGTTVSAVSSLSMDPPMMLVCLNRSSATHDAIQKSGIFGVNILSQNQGDIAFKFARKGLDKFDGVGHTVDENSVPLIDGSLATISCRVVETAVGGTHTIFMGVVQDAASHPGRPLTYYRGTFGRFEHEAENKAYADIRAHVLARKTPVGDGLDPIELAATLETRPEFLETALVRLETEGLVEVSSDASYVVSPITSEKARGFFTAQAAIEAGVIEMHLPEATDQQLAELRNAGDAFRSSTDMSVEEQLQFAREFHVRLLELSSSKQLLGAFSELNTLPLWLNTVTPEDEETFLNREALTSLIDAVLARNVEAAKAALRSHTAHVINLAENAITANNGSV